MIIERQIQKVRPGKWEELQAIDKKFTDIENRVGHPAKTRSTCISGGHTTNTLIVERQWESLAVMEAAFKEIAALPEWQALGAEVMKIIESQQRELYALLP
jgi:hypothetical protein